MSRPTAEWHAVTASVMGSSHQRTGLPNQDAVLARSTTDGTPGWVAAVADGHGGARYVRSDIGSSMCVEVACDAAERAIRELGVSPSRREIERRLSDRLVPQVVDAWVDRVTRHHADHPFLDDERVRAKHQLDGETLVAYGCTLVLALVTSNWVGLVQIGDGDATVVSTESVDAPVPGDDRLVGGETTSLCLPSARQDARVAAVMGNDVDVVILTSDGYANSFAGGDWRERAGEDLRRQVIRDGLADVGTRLPEWLAASAEAGGDDVSMALLARVHLGERAPTSHGGTEVVHSEPGRGDRPGLRRALPVAAAVVGLLAGFGVGQVVGPSDNTSPTSTTAVTSQTTTVPSTEPPAVTSTTLVAPAAVRTMVGPARVLGLAFNPADPANSKPSIAWQRDMDGQDVPSGTLPAGWTLESTGEFKRPRARVVRDVQAVVLIDDRLWVLRRNGTVGEVLTAYDVSTGTFVGESPLVSASQGPTIITTTASTTPTTAASRPKRPGG